MAGKRDISRQLKRLGWILGSTTGVIVSLLTFPNALPWMVAGWILCHIALVLRGRPGWIPLATCAAIVLVKNVDWSPALILLAGVTLIIGAWRGFAPGEKLGRWSRRADWTSVTVISAAWLVFACSWWAAAHCSRKPTPPTDRPIVCLGDSLTAFGYPDDLTKMISIPVINHGADGITIAEGLKRLPEIIEANPAMVVIELGGHDYLRGRTRAATKANLQEMIDACQTIDAEVILMEIPRGFIVDPYGGLERELARENDLELISDTAIRNLVLWSPFAPPGMWFGSDRYLSDDGLHPNERGNRFLAECVTDALVRRYGEGIRAR